MKNIHNPSTNRLTHQKLLVYEAVKKSQSHPSAEEIYKQVQKAIPRLSLATVYRNLDQLVSSGLIAKKQLGNIMRFERNTQPHYHVVCLACDKIQDLDSSPATDIEEFFSRSTPYRLTTHELTLYGVCPHCQKKR